MRTESLKPSSERQVVWSWRGRRSYQEGLDLQEKAVKDLEQGAPERLFLLEHDAVYTVGRNAQARGEAIPAAKEGVEVFLTNRGGQVTYHGPGQLVGYPILDLNPDRRDVRVYVQNLEEVLVRTLATYGIEAEAKAAPEIGVWTERGKIASLGIHLSRWRTTHGFALNVSTDLEYFSHITPCGLPGVRMVSMKSLLGKAPELPEVAGVVAREFSEVFGQNLREDLREVDL